MMALSEISSTMDPVEVTTQYIPRSYSILQVSIIVFWSNNLYSITGLNSTLFSLQTVKQALISFLILFQSPFSIWCGFSIRSIVKAALLIDSVISCNLTDVSLIPYGKSITEEKIA